MAQQKLRNVATVLNQLSEAIPSETLLKTVSSNLKPQALVASPPTTASEPQTPIPGGPPPVLPIVSNDKPFSIGEEAILLRGLSEGLSYSEIVQKYLKDRSKKSCKKAVAIINNRVERNNTWTREEDVRLQQAVAETRQEYWEKIAKKVGGGRTWSECSIRMAATTTTIDD